MSKCPQLHTIFELFGKLSSLVWRERITNSQTYVTNTVRIFALSTAIYTRGICLRFVFWKHICIFHSIFFFWLVLTNRRGLNSVKIYDSFLLFTIHEERRADFGVPPSQADFGKNSELRDLPPLPSLLCPLIILNFYVAFTHKMLRTQKLTLYSQT